MTVIPGFQPIQPPALTDLDAAVHTEHEPTTGADVARYVRDLGRYWVDLAEYVEGQYTNRALIPVLASVLTIFGAALIGANL